MTPTLFVKTVWKSSNRHRNMVCYIITVTSLCAEFVSIIALTLLVHVMFVIHFMEPWESLLKWREHSIDMTCQKCSQLDLCALETFKSPQPPLVILSRQESPEISYHCIFYMLKAEVKGRLSSYFLLVFLLQSGHSLHVTNIIIISP